VLNRGYSILNDEQGKVLANYKDYESLKKGSTVKVKFYDGSGQLLKQ
jgi:exonuclease VII large subunit